MGPLILYLVVSYGWRLRPLTGSGLRPMSRNCILNISYCKFLIIVSVIVSAYVPTCRIKYAFVMKWVEHFISVCHTTFPGYPKFEGHRCVPVHTILLAFVTFMPYTAPA